MENKTQNKDVHVYDGIVEENNPMPGWWIWLFILTVIFAFLYWLHYEIGGGPTLKQEYAQELAAYNKMVEKNAMSGAADSEELLIAYMQNEQVQLQGATLFSEKCAMCHGVHLEGKIGPNLTDNFWIFGKGTRLDVVRVIREGSPVKGMPAWQSLLKPAEIKNVAAFVFSRIGSKPANAKAPDGVDVK